jgi:RNA polymerase sigma-70 factor (ECF subfamily)
MHQTNGKIQVGSPNSTNALLLSSCLAGDRRQLGELVDLYRPYLMALARGDWRGGLRAKEGISDLVQETMVKGIGAFSEFRGKTEGEFSARLRQILKRQMQNAARHYRTEQRNAGREEPLDGHCLTNGEKSPSKEMMAEETRERLEIALGQLPTEYMEVIRLRLVVDLSWEEIGVRLERTADAARKLWARAIVQLQQNVNLQKHVAPAAD